MVRVLRYPRLCAASCLGAVLCALCRDIAVAEEIAGWPAALLILTILLLVLCFVLMSCRFFVDYEGVGVGFLFRVRRTPWHDLAALGALCCNSRRMYLYGLYNGSADFFNLLHHAPRCGSWGFVVPLSGKLAASVQAHCPYSVLLTKPVKSKPTMRQRPLLQQASLYLLAMLPAAAVAFSTCALMLVRSAHTQIMTSSLALILGAFAFAAAGIFLLRSALVSVLACPGISEAGVCAGRGLYLPWDEVLFAYVHRVPQGSGMFFLSKSSEDAKQRGCAPVQCLSLPDLSTLVLAYLTYCPHAKKGLVD